MDKGFLIRMMTWEENKDYPTMIKAFYSKDITELLKLYLIAKEQEIPINIPREEEGHSKFDGKIAYVENVDINFGGYEAITCLNIYVRVVEWM